MVDKNNIERTLLHEFLLNRFKNYVEPQRKGTPKGAPIGFSKDKYEASLLTLYGVKQKKIAKDINISYGLLRKWNTEKVFQDTVMKHCIEYAEYVLTYLREKANKELQEADELLKKPLNEIATYTRPQWDFKKFQDYSLYSPLLQMIIDNFLGSAIDKAIKENDQAFMAILYTIMGVFLHFSGVKQTEEIKEQEKRALRLLEKSLLTGIKNILLKKTITKKDRKQAVLFLRCLEQAKE